MTRGLGTRRWMAGVIAAGGLLVACSADKVDYKKAAEKVARETVEGLVPGDATADCGDPDSTDIGTLFDCTGTASDGTVYTFSAEITKEKEVTVTLLDTGTPPGGATDDTVTGDTVTGDTGTGDTGTGDTSNTLPSEETVAVDASTATTAAG